ncbi:tyrosine-type recombinase/integrase [Nocardiopsis sp. HNM0947]|uniref:Tyrosine-type recombinase/integrase n=1 Tax=Nocardiopsis coralli TaxID=2772213 RepID=A0ABR9P4G1_9ACTN|nr:tyrosine-type recombinase/integrase [Nocardiopsis coralli]MBE2998732.1 tyrosine-type recombinase/integrase [Nocardiopsis coralli]
MIDPDDLSYKVAIWKTEVYKGARATTHTVRWRVGTKRHREPLRSGRQAEAFRAQLVQAQSRGEAFSISRGRPVSVLRATADKEAQERQGVTWYDFAVSYVDHKWSDTSAKHRANIAFALMMATTALLSTDRGMPDPILLRGALKRWAFSKTNRAKQQPAEVEAALRWVAQNCRTVGELSDPGLAGSMVQAVTRDLHGRNLKVSSQRRNHSIIKAALAHAVSEGLLDYSPIKELEVKSSSSVHQVDRRCVINPRQAGQLLNAVREYGDEHTDQKSGPRLVAFFAVMYYAALRPEEAVNLRRHDLVLPEPKHTTSEDGEEELTYDWGTIYVGQVTPDAEPAFTDDGSNRDTRDAPKQRGAGEVRPVPCDPELTRLLWEHMEEFGTDSRGRLFTGVRDGTPLASSTYRRAWSRARDRALTESEAASPLARRPYDLRHTCVSTWLNAGVSTKLVAQWAGHSVAVLQAIYAKCLVGEEEQAKTRIEEARKRF